MPGIPPNEDGSETHDTPEGGSDPSEGEEPTARAGRFHLCDRIGRGGMGDVLRARDPDLGRELAVKVLREDHRGRPELVRRFIEEAQIGGQLQHPGIVPIYDLGALTDRRPFFAMKLVQGRELAALLAERKDPSEDLPKYLAIFEQVCQTVAYAHARGVTHRDLKPLNIMVGGFGEVQVMDWGLAKVLTRDASSRRRPGEGRPDTPIETVRCGSDADASLAGSVMGTPAYMPPEQARGEVANLDERADVFALGSILCEVLTGRPAYVGRDRAEVRMKAARGELADAMARLGTCGAEADLVALARTCLSPDIEARPRDARSVAGAVTGHLTGVQARLRAAELAQVKAQTRAVEERKRAVVERQRRRLTVALAASVLLITGLGGLGALAYQRQFQEEFGRVELAEGALTQRLAAAREAWAERQDISGYDRAVEAARAVESMLTARLPAALRERVRDRVTAARAEADVARDDRQFLDDLTTIRASAIDLDFDVRAAYRNAFLERGIDPLSGATDPKDLALTMRRRRPEAILLQLAAFLDDWSVFLRSGRPPDHERADRVASLARSLDPDPWRDALRQAWQQPEPAGRSEFLRLVQSPGVADQPALTLVALAEAVRSVGEPRAAVALLEPARFRRPADAWIFVELGRSLRAARPPRTEDAIRAFTAAFALRPAMGYDLAMALRETGRTSEAIAVLESIQEHQVAGHISMRLGEMQKDAGLPEEAAVSFTRAAARAREQLARNPSDTRARMVLGAVLNELGDRDAAIAALRESIRLEPGEAATHQNLAVALADSGDLPGAIAACREAIRLKPDNPEAHVNLGVLLSMSGDLPGAIAAHREAARLQPDLAIAHLNLAAVLYNSGDLPGALAAAREAVRLKPDDIEAQINLAVILSETGDLPGSLRRLREAARLRPDMAAIQVNLATTLGALGDAAGALEAAREAVRLGPDVPEAWQVLGERLIESRDPPGAARAFREAIRLRPDYAEAHTLLGLALGRQGLYAEALPEVRRGHELGSRQPVWPHPSAEWLGELERLATLTGRLPAVLRGESEPASNAERLDFARMAYDTANHAASARLYSEVLAADPELARDRGAQTLYHAACAAAMAAAGDGEDKPGPDRMARDDLRRQALGWLRAERSAWADVLENGQPQARTEVAPTLRRWKTDPDLASVRDEAELARLPGREREDWRDLWAEVDALLESAGTPDPAGDQAGPGEP